MAKNKILKAGDLVKYHVEDQRLNGAGFILGQIYKVVGGNGMLCIEVDPEQGIGCYLVIDHVLTDSADHFAKHNCPVLPQGRVKL